MTSRRLVIGLLAVGMATAPAAVALGPADFAVNIPAGPSVGGPPAGTDPTANCTPPVGTALVSECPSSYSWSASASPMNGTVSRISDGATGTITGACDWNMVNTMGIRVTFPSLPPTSAPTSEVTSFGGNGGQACSWAIRIGADTLVGTMSGTSTLTQPNPTTGRFTGNLDIIVVGGAGAYAQANGSGSMVQEQEFPLQQPSAPTGSSPFERAFGARANQAGGSTMDMRLRNGSPKATFLIPSGAITRATNWKVHLAVPPKSSCTVGAKLGTTKVNLGRLQDKKGTGTLVGSKRIGLQLRKTGNWKLTASCTVPKVAKGFSTSARLKLRS